MLQKMLRPRRTNANECQDQEVIIYCSTDINCYTDIIDFVTAL